MALALYALVAILILRFLGISAIARLVLFLLPFLFTGRALLTSRVYGPVDHPYISHPLNWMKEEYGIGAPHNAQLSDLYCQMIPWREAVRWSLSRGEWPLWNPFLLSGDILAASAQPAPYSPLTLLALLLPVPLGLTFSAALAHFLAALGAFLFARELGCREPAALIGAAGWTCATSIVFFILWPLGIAWISLPFVLLGIHRAWFAMLTGAFAMLLLSGHPETALHVVFVAIAYALSLRSRRVLVNGFVSGVAALGVTAIFVLPMLEAAPQTMEHATRTGALASHGQGVGAEEMLARLSTDFFPSLHTIDTAAVGSIVLALALFAIGRVRSRESWFFAGLAVFGLLAHAQWKPFARALQSLPLFDTALNERLSFAAAFALAMLAALGVERLLAHESRSVAVAFVLMLIAAVIGNAWAVRTTTIAHTPIEWGRHVIAAEVGGVVLGACFASMRAPYLLLATLLVQRLLSAGGIYRSFEPRAAYPPIPLFEAMKSVREPFRITGHGVAFVPGTSTMYGLEDVRGYQAMTFQRYRETYPIWCVHQPVWFNRVDDLTRPFLSFLNVRFAITWDRDPPPDGWREVARQRGSILLENTRVLDRVFVPRRIRIGYNAPDTLAQMQQETDFRERAWIESRSAPHERVNGPGTLTFTNTAREYVIDADMQRAGWIVASLPAWSGWRAFIDGKAIGTSFANHAFLGVPVPAGNHRVRLVYLPRSFVIGRWITLATLAAIAIRTFRDRARRRSAMMHR